MRKTLAVVLAVTLMAGMVSAQAQELPEPGALPGDATYGIERAMESFNMAVTSFIGSQEDVAEQRLHIAEKRLAEARELQTRANSSEEVAEAVDRYQNRMVQAQQLAEGTNVSEVARNRSKTHVDVLEEVSSQLPDDAQEGIRNAIENAKKNAERRQKGETVGKSDIISPPRGGIPDQTPNEADNGDQPSGAGSPV